MARSKPLKEDGVQHVKLNKLSPYLCCLSQLPNMFFTSLNADEKDLGVDWVWLSINSIIFKRR